ncbi:hepatoma-derived growth factor-related protein 2-like [Heptranchias perlo]|uniref:hepatoma-derived growth factor-related protein 2-like n=1 Tax=Heptranchias perlo TaxID=212740 RepID=UPI00355A2D56
MYLKNYRQCPYPAERASYRKEMELVYKRCLQSEPEAHGQSPRSQSLPRAHNKRQQTKHIPQHKPSSDESSKEQGGEVHQKSARLVMHRNQNERKDSCSGNDPVKAGRSKVHQRENKEHTIHDDQKRSPEKPVKSCNDSSHKSRETATVKPLPSRNSERDTSKLLVPDAAPKDSPSLPCSSLSKKEVKPEVRVKKTPSKTEKNAQGTNSTAQIPVRITPRIDGISRTSGNIIVPRTESLREPPVMKTKSNESRSSEPPVKRKKTVQAAKPEIPKESAQEMQKTEIPTDVMSENVEEPSSGFCGNDLLTNIVTLAALLANGDMLPEVLSGDHKMISTISGKTIQGSTGADMQNLDHQREEAAFRVTTIDDEISDDDIFRETPEQYSHKITKTKENTIVKFKGERLQLNDAPSRDNASTKKYSHRNSGNTKEASHCPSRDLKSHGAPSTDCKVSTAGKDILAREPSRLNTTSIKDRPKKETLKDPRSALILAKRDKLMKTYRLDCEIFAMVAKQLVNQEPTIEKQVQSALRKSLHQIGERCLEDLKKSIAKYDAVNAVKKPN